VRPLADEYDLAILDCPPSISLVSESVFEAADALLVPLIPTTLSVRTFEQLLTFVGAEVARRPEVIAFFSMVDRRKQLHRELVADLPMAYPSIAAAAIPTASEVERMGVDRAPVVVSAPGSRAAKAYAALWRETQARLVLPPPVAGRLR
jgi:cellulose biosynthesis protein BcsQ